MALSNYAGQRGDCFPSQERLAEETEQSVDTVQRRMSDLAKAGFIYRPRQNRKGSGHFGVGITIVLCSADAVDYARSLGYAPNAETTQNGVENETSEGEIACHHRTAGSGAAEPQEAAPPYRTGAAQNSQEDITLTPKSPFPKPEPPPPDDGFTKDWLEFEKSWPWAEGEAREPARRHFGKIAAADRPLAIRGIGGFVAFRQRKQRRLGPARMYLRDRCWEATVGTQSADPFAGQVWIEKDSPEWLAWAAWHRARNGGRSLFAFHHSLPSGRRSYGRFEKSLYPPGDSEPFKPEDL